MTGALSRRSALRGSAIAALGLAAGVAPALASVAPVETKLLVSADATLIEFAARLAALARRENYVHGLLIDAQNPIDRWDFANKPREPKPNPTPRMVMADLSTSTHRIMQFSEALDPDPAQKTPNKAYDDYRAACKAHRRTVAAMVEGSDVPRLKTLSDRMCSRLRRFVDQLADMQPQTTAGVAAKAASVMALGDRNGGELLEDEIRLALSLCEDVVRLGSGVAA